MTYFAAAQYSGRYTPLFTVRFSYALAVTSLLRRISIPVRLGVVLVFILGLLNVLEINSVMSLERGLSTKQMTIQKTKNVVTRLSIDAISMQSSETVKEAALTAQMVSADAIQYVSLRESSFARADVR